MPIFNLRVPTRVSNVPDEVLMPVNAWADKENYNQTLSHLAQLFQKVRGCMQGRKLVWLGGGRGCWGSCGRVGVGSPSNLDWHSSSRSASCTQNFKKFEDGGGHVTPEEAQKILQAGPVV